VRAAGAERTRESWAEGITQKSINEKLLVHLDPGKTKVGVGTSSCETEGEIVKRGNRRVVRREKEQHSTLANVSRVLTLINDIRCKRKRGDQTSPQLKV